MIRQEWDRIRARAAYSWDGWTHVWKAERSLMQWVVANAVSVPLALILPIGGGERAAILMGGVMVLAAECFNTAIERVVDDVSEERRPRAKQAKDAGSAGVAVTAIAVGIAWLVALARLVF